MIEKTTRQGAWGAMWAELWVLIPTKVTEWLSRGKEKHRKHPLLYIMTGLIVSLAIASMWNFVTRASTHHAGVSAYLGGIALAGLVPVTVFFAVYANITPGQRRGVWAIAGLFVFLSASIQFPVYAGARLTLDYLFSSQFDLEAFAFGAGNPIAECLIAVMEAMYLNSLAKESAQRVAEDEQAKLEEAAAAEQAERERKEQIRLDLEAETKRVQEQREFDLKLKIQEAEAMARIERERMKAEAKLAGKPVQESVQKTVQASKGKRLKKPEILDRMIVHYRENPHLSARDMADLVGISKSSVANYLDELGQKNIVHVNGNGVEVLRDL